MAMPSRLARARVTKSFSRTESYTAKKYALEDAGRITIPVEPENFVIREWTVVE